jgi:hypothetical protein
MIKPWCPKQSPNDPAWERRRAHIAAYKASIATVLARLVEVVGRIKATDGWAQIWPQLSAAHSEAKRAMRALSPPGGTPAQEEKTR